MAVMGGQSSSDEGSTDESLEHEDNVQRQYRRQEAVTKFSGPPGHEMVTVDEGLAACSQPEISKKRNKKKKITKAKSKLSRIPSMFNKTKAIKETSFKQPHSNNYVPECSKTGKSKIKHSKRDKMRRNQKHNLDDASTSGSVRELCDETSTIVGEMTIDVNQEGDEEVDQITYAFKEVNDRERKVYFLQAANNELNIDKKKTQKNTHDRDLDVLRLQLANDKMRLEMCSLQWENGEIKNDNQSMQGLEEQYMNMESKMQRLQSKKKSMITDNQRVQSENKAMYENIQRVQSEKDKMDENMQSVQSENTDMNENIHRFRLENGNMTTIIQHQARNLQRLRLENEAVTTDRQQLQSDKETMRTDMERLRSENGNMNESMQRFRLQNRDINMNLQRVQSENRDMTTNMQRHETENRDMATNMQRLESENRDMTTNMQRLESEYRDMTTNMQRLETENRDMATNMQRLESENRDMTTNMQRLHDQLQNENMQRLRLENENTNTNTQRIQQELESIVTERGLVITWNEEVGRGAYGTVYKGEYYGAKVAVKKFHDAISTAPYYLNMLRREINIASQCRHPNLLQFLCEIKDVHHHLLIVIELMDMSLRNLQQERSSATSRLEKPEVKSISQDVARGLDYLHRRQPSPIIHRDVSSANVLLAIENGQVRRAKVSDYGSANFMRACNTANPGASIYAAPEASGAQQDTKIDVFSYGVLIYEMCICELPVNFERDRLNQLLVIEDGHVRDMVLNCTAYSKEERPTMQEVLGNGLWQNLEA